MTFQLIISTFQHNVMNVNVIQVIRDCGSPLCLTFPHNHDEHVGTVYDRLLNNTFSQCLLVVVSGAATFNQRWITHLMVIFAELVFNYGHFVQAQRLVTSDAENPMWKGICKCNVESVRLL